MVGRSVAQQLQVLGRVLVVAGHEEGHEAVEEGLAGRVVGEEGVPVDVVEAAVLGAGGAAAQVVRTRLQAQQPVQPGLALVAAAVPDGLLELARARTAAAAGPAA